ncbi:MAG: tryptophan synthase subunit alpha [Thaumarchaeota archaeon]|nr:tryptophan synthase subunit alpha [Nitrososphaerota archaeon]
MAKSFRSLQDRKEGALIAYITAGYPSPEDTEKIGISLVDAGIDMIELGIPFSDPIADGPTIQKASMESLNSGTTPMKVLAMALSLRSAINIPIIIMTYYNPVFQIGAEKFFKLSRDSGVDGVIIPDLPLEEAQEVRKAAKQFDIDLIFLASVTTPMTRIKRIVEATSGFLYFVSIQGVTGARQDIGGTITELVRKTAEIMGETHLAVGFGISSPDQVRDVLRSGANGVIVGSSIIDRIGTGTDSSLEELTKFISDLKAATKPA